MDEIYSHKHNNGQNHQAHTSSQWDFKSCMSKGITCVKIFPRNHQISWKQFFRDWGTWHLMNENSLFAWPLIFQVFHSRLDLPRLSLTLIHTLKCPNSTLFFKIIKIIQGSRRTNKCVCFDISTHILSNFFPNQVSLFECEFDILLFQSFVFSFWFLRDFISLLLLLFFGNMVSLFDPCQFYSKTTFLYLCQNFLLNDYSSNSRMREAMIFLIELLLKGFTRKCLFFYFWLAIKGRGPL